MKKSLLVGGLLAATPLALLLPGCSGGSSSFGTPSATATPRPTTTATPTSGTTAVSNLTLGNGQRAILTTIKNGTALTGTLQIVATPVTRARKSAAIPFQFAFGSYAITGTITPAGVFNISGNFGAQGAFSMTGQLQTATTNGSYTLSVNGQTETGVLPKTGTPFPGTTPTPAPTSSGNYNLTANLSFSAVTAGSEVIATPITSFNNLTNGGTLTNLSSTASAFKGQNLLLSGQDGRVSGNGTSRLIQFGFGSYTVADILAGANKPFSVGQIIDITANPTANALQYSQSSVNGTAIGVKVWRAVSGNVVVKAIGTNSATVELQNVRVDPSPIFGGTGSFTLNGTLAGTGLTVTTQ